MIKSIKYLFIDQSINHSRRTIIISFIITLIFSLGANFILLDDNIMNLLPEDINSRRIWDEIVEEFNYSEYMFIAFGNQNQNIFSSENLSTLWDISKLLESNPYVDGVISIPTTKRIESYDGFLEITDLMPSRVLNSEQIESLTNYLETNNNLNKQLISKNLDYFNIIILPENEKIFPELVTEVKKITKPYESLYEFHLGGQPYIAGEVPKLIKTETQQLMIIGLFIMSLVLLINLRSLISVAMILLLIIMSMFSMVGFLGWIYYFTKSEKFIFTFLNSSMPIILLTIANSDGVHIISRFFREAKKSKDVKSAITSTLNRLSLPIFLTSITTSAAFLTMISSPITSMTGYGISIGFGILCAWILSCTMLPSLINLKKWNFSSAALSTPSLLEHVISLFSKKILNNPKSILIYGIFIVLLSSVGIQYINVEVNLINLFKKQNSIKESTLFLDKEMAGSMNLMMKVEGDLKDPDVLNQMIIIQQYLENNPYINNSISIANIIQEMHKVIMDNNPKYYSIPDSRKKINNLFTMYSISGNPEDFESLINYNYDTGLLTAMMHTVSTRDVVHIVNDINSFLNSEQIDLDIEISGLMIFLKDFVSLVIKSSINSIIISIFLILFIVRFFFKSWQLGLLAVLPLTSAIILNFGLMGWFGIDLTHFTALLTSIIIGVGVDFAIHYISDFINYKKNKVDLEKISCDVVDNVGYPILLDVFSNMGFGALIFSSLIPLVHMGGLMLFAMISTSLGTLTILAAIMEIYKHQFVIKV